MVVCTRGDKKNTGKKLYKVKIYIKVERRRIKEMGKRINEANETINGIWHKNTGIAVFGVKYKKLRTK